MMNKDNTPSFYTENDFFLKYLGQTSYYLTLQKTLIKLISVIKNDNLLDLGCSNGATSLEILKSFTNIHIDAVDMREEVLSIASKNLNKFKKRVDLINADMSNYVKMNLQKYDCIYLLYSFHHIEDPNRNKEFFLENCYRNMKEGASLIILETFLPEVSDEALDFEVEKLFHNRSMEGYASTFWASFENSSQKSLDNSKQIGAFSKLEESRAGKLVLKRENEYLIKRSWLCKKAENIGFKTVLTEPCNNLCDGVVLLQK